MNKIPVGKTIVDAYSYGFGQFPANIGIVWLPMAVLVAAGWFAVPGYFAAMTHMMQSMSAMKPGVPGAPPVFPDMMGLIQVYRLMALFYLAELFAISQIMLGMTRRALGMQQGPVFFFLSFGAPFWRVFGGYLVVIVLMIAIYLAAIIAGVVLVVVIAMIGAGAGATAGHGSVVAGIAAGVGGVAAIVALVLGMFYIVLRLTFLLVPAIVAEDRFAVMRSWELTRGNFWRSFIVILGIVLPLMIVAIIVEFTVLAHFGVSMFPAAHIGSNDPQAAAAMLNTMGTTVFDLLRRYWYLLAGVALVTSALHYGLFAGAAASAYRSQTAPEPGDAAA